MCEKIPKRFHWSEVPLPLEVIRCIRELKRKRAL